MVQPLEEERKLPEFRIAREDIPLQTPTSDPPEPSNRSMGFYLSVLEEIRDNVRRGIEAPIRQNTASSEALEWAVWSFPRIERALRHYADKDTWANFRTQSGHGETAPVTSYRGEEHERGGYNEIDGTRVAREALE